MRGRTELSGGEQPATPGRKRASGESRGRTPPLRAELRRHSRPLAVAAGGLGVVAAVLVSTVLSVSGPQNGGTDGDRVTGGRTHTAAAGQVPARQFAEPRPEKCEDGKDPAASLKPSKASGPAVDRIKGRENSDGSKGRLVVGVDQNSYLWGYRDPATGSIDGFDIDLVRAIAKDLLGPDAKVTYKTIPTDQRIPAVRSGDVDMVVRTMTVNCDRIKDVAFSTAYFEAGQQLLAPKENARVTGFNGSLRGKRLCYAEGSTAQELMRTDDYRALGARPVVVPNQLDCLVRLQLDEADAVLTDSALGAGQAAQDPSVRLIGSPVTSEPYGVAMNLKDKDLVSRVNKVLDDYRSGGKGSKWRASFDKWLADDMMDTAPPKPKYRD